MLTPILNEIRFDLVIVAKGPLLIREGRLTGDEQESWKDGFEKEGIIHDKDHRDSLPDNFFVSRNSEAQIKTMVKNSDFSGFTYYLPGSSLRGVLRSRAEYIARKLSPKGQLLCCNPFNSNFCGGHFENATQHETHQGPLLAKTIYQQSCAVCRLFGHTAMASRIEIEDTANPITVENTVRDHIAIDRFTGGVRGGAVFKDMCVEQKEFISGIRLFNFETWQVGLLAYVLRDLEQGLVPVGGGKSKGYGEVTIRIENLRVRYWETSQRSSFVGFGGLGSEFVTGYDCLAPAESVNIQLQLADEKEQSLYYRTYILPQAGTGISDSPFWAACAKVWNRVVPAKNGSAEQEPRLKTLKELRQ